MSLMSQTLLVDAGLQPLRTISWQKAITLWTLDKVEIISEYDGFVHSQTLVIKIPAVVRLLRVFKKFRRPVKFNRISIFARDRYRCGYCGIKGTINELTYDHVIPKAHGGRTEWHNILTACYLCNQYKGGRTPEQAKMKLLWKPFQPDWVPALEIQLSKQTTPSQWRDYLYWHEPLLEE